MTSVRLEKRQPKKLPVGIIKIVVMIITMIILIAILAYLHGIPYYNTLGGA